MPKKISRVEKNYLEIIAMLKKAHVNQKDIDYIVGELKILDEMAKNKKMKAEQYENK
jgi:hypothetical protein